MDFLGFMNRKKYTVKQLAELLGVTTDTVYAYKNGKCCPSYDVLEKLLLDGATIREMFSDRVSDKVRETFQAGPQEPLDEAEIVRKGLLELARRIQG